MRKANSSAIGLLAFVLMLSLVFPAAALSSPGDPLTWRDSTWDYRSEDSADIKSEIEPAKVFGVASLTFFWRGLADLDCLWRCLWVCF